jgi:NAD(P)-dependent dehydrogenase (short-subunit alcohol dehydrogenase family)
MTNPPSSNDPSRQIQTATTARNIAITGATDGMGKEAAKELARQGVQLLLIGRNPERCEAVKAECIAESGNQQVDYVVADLSTVGEVRRAAAEIQRRLDRVDTLVNNAGGTFPWRRTETEEGLEVAFMLQYLSRYVLTKELLDHLRASKDPLVMAVAGGGTYAKDFDLDDLQSERDYKKFRLIGKTAALNELLTQEQAQRYTGITFYNYGPGLVRTKTTMATPMARIFFQSIGRLFTRSPEQAGADMAKLAAGGYEGGFYGPKLKRNEPVWAQANATVGSALWEKTEELLGGLAAGAGKPPSDML